MTLALNNTHRRHQALRTSRCRVASAQRNARSSTHRSRRPKIPRAPEVFTFARLRFALLGLFGAAATAGLILLASFQPVSAQGSTAQGAAVFKANCASCHGDQGQGAFEGPSLHAIPTGDKTVAGVEGIVRSGLPNMTSFGGKLSTDDIQAVAEYVVSSFATQGDVPTGGENYRINCAGCHGATLHGGALIYNHQNAPNLTDVSPALVAAAVRGGFGTMPAFNSAALTDKQVASIAAYVEALQSPAHPGGISLVFPGPVTEGFIALVFGLGAAVLAAVWVERGGRG